jgi:molybdenum cofactor guanylyltransferase
VAHHEVAGVLLVGGASRRFGSAKALAQLRGETLAEHCHRALADAFEHVIVVGKKRDELPLPFPVLDDGTDVRAAIVGVAAGLRLADADVCVVLPTDVPAMTPEALQALSEASVGVDAAVPRTGPLPGAYRRSALPVLERRIAADELALRDALGELQTKVADLDSAVLVNVNTPADLARFADLP